MQSMGAALKLDPPLNASIPLSEKPPLGSKRFKPKLVWVNPNLTHGTHKEKSKAKLRCVSGVRYKYIDPDGNLPIVVIVPLVAKAIDIGISAYDTYTAYQEGGAKGAAKEAGTSAALSVVPGAKIAKKVVDGDKRGR